MHLKTPTIHIRGLKMGDGHPVVIQSMTNTDTADPEATAAQCIELADAGAELVRITVNSNLAAQAVPIIRNLLDQRGYQHLPLVGDFHYNGHTLLTDFPDCALALDKYRINPGNVGHGEKHDYNFATIIKVAIKNKKPIRIGVNWGSLDQDLLTEMMNQNAKLVVPKSDKAVIIDAMVESALRSAKLAEDLGLANDRIVLSVKMSVLQDMVAAYELLAKRLLEEGRSYGIHLGLTEAGVGIQGLVSSAAALGILLQQNIGDTIRISLTPTPEMPRTEEVEACKQLLQAMGIRSFRPKVTSCPGCGRTDSRFFQELAAEVNSHIDKKMPEWEKAYPEVKNLKIAVMGCIVNGPGEAQHADISISLPGRLEKPVAPVYIHGKYTESLSGKDIPQQFLTLLENFIKENF